MKGLEEELYMDYAFHLCYLYAENVRQKMDCSTLTCVLNVTSWILVQTLDLEDSLNQWYLKRCMVGIMPHNKTNYIV